MVSVARQLVLVVTRDLNFGVSKVFKGSTAVAEKKTEDGQQLVFIGYSVGLVTEMIALSDKNMLRLVYGFFTVDLNHKVPVRVVEKLVSWNSRYSVICPAMKPFSRALYSLVAGMTNRCALVEFTSEARRAVRLWRAMLVLLAEDGISFDRTIRSFVSDTRPCYIVEFDASLTGVGILWYRRDSNVPEVSLGGGAVDISGFWK